ncbi:hypothetical protein THAOC_37458 [Thalassiosira oceanica]|uniref:DUF6820 domain-containing protein n=1 Tax=Thalassiosira oceanica TaxID=159749 RepID=K0RBW2_THAOC|nr:hypothetical protein THAOC_37458 [Thalassiosira oceanica]|eukprot:EJK44037.1 hypothetical protein THAOC_37458 [Thalassiosira oceanica]
MITYERAGSASAGQVHGQMPHGADQGRNRHGRRNFRTHNASKGGHPEDPAASHGAAVRPPRGVQKTWGLGQRRRPICKSEVEREAYRQRCRRDAAEETSTDIGLEGGEDGPRWTRGTFQGLSSIPHLTSVAAGFYRNDRNDVINGSETSVGRARAMMSEFAVAPACLIDNGGRRAIGIALRRMNFFLCDLLRPTSGVREDGGVYPSCSAKCPLHANGSIGSVRGLRRPQTTIDASSVVDLSAPMCSRPSHEQFFRSRVSLLRAADVAGN